MQIGDWQAFYRNLRPQNGLAHWWPADSAFEVMVGAILTQNTAWSNVEQAVARLRVAKLLSVAAILAAPEATLHEALRPAGYFRIKTRRLRALCQFLAQAGCADAPERLATLGNLSTLRRKLLAVHGVGEETADAILLYALKLPAMVVDAYTRRIASRLGWVSAQISYGELQAQLEAAMPAAGVEERQEFHALIVQLAKSHCRPRPHCMDCPVQIHCAHGRAVTV